MRMPYLDKRLIRRKRQAMHELGVTKSIVEVVVRHAQEQSANQVRSVNLIIGEMRNLEEEWVRATSTAALRARSLKGRTCRSRRFR